MSHVTVALILDSLRLVFTWWRHNNVTMTSQRITVRNVRKLFQDSSSGQKCQKMSVTANSKNVRKWYQERFKMSKMTLWDFSDIYDPISDIFWLGSILNIFETKQSRIWKKISDIFAGNRYDDVTMTSRWRHNDVTTTSDWENVQVTWCIRMI